jgi:hypothetical protein
MECQVDGVEELGEPFRPRLFRGHGNSLPGSQIIVNPDASWPAW